jgi:Ca-activated chloride channel homolog
MKPLHITSTLLFAVPLLALPACGDAGGGDGSYDDGGPGESAGDDAGDDGGGGLGVGQGGSQDFGQFKEILDRGEIPGPNTIDDVGFFNEHKIELPKPTCADDVCLHGLYGEMGNMISGSGCITVLVGMNTPLDVEDIERPPLNLSVVVDTSGSMKGEPIEYARQGLERMLDGLLPGDKIHLVTFSSEARVVTEAVEGDAPELVNGIAEIAAAGGTNIYDGLYTGFALVDQHYVEGAQNRVVLLSDGEATEGITNDAQIVEMAAAYAGLGYGLTTIGVGQDFDVELMRTLSEQASGSFYFLEDPAAVKEVFHEEVTSFLIPLAADVKLGVDIGDEYLLRGIYGTKLFNVTAGHGEIAIPNLQIAHRTSVDDHDDGGRRGGGGAILLELIRKSGQTPVEHVGTLNLHYRKPNSEETVDQAVDIQVPVDPSDVDLENGTFEDASVEKSFVMLNIFVGFQMAATRAQQGDYDGAWNVLDALERAVSGWLAVNPDFDIEDDLSYVSKFKANVLAKRPPDGQPTPTPVPPPNPWPQD